MELIGENEKCVASKCREVEGAAGTTVDNPSATEDVWEIVNHLLTSYNQQSKLKNSSSETSLQDFIANPSQNEGTRNDFTAQNESGKEKKIQELAQEFVQQTTPTLQCPISEQLQVINEEDLAAVLPDVEGSGSLEGFVSLNTRNNDSPSTLIESLDGAYGGVSVALNLSEPVQISEGATAPPAPSNAQNPHQNGAHYSPLATTERAENISSSENTDLINPLADRWLLKPSPGYECTPLSSEIDLSEQKSPDSNFSSCRSLRSSVKRRQSQNLDSIHCDGEQSVKIDCSVSHVSLDSGFGGSPSYTSSPNSAYLYSPLSVETKSPSSRARGYELCFKRSQSSPEQNEKMDDTMQESLFTERESAGTSQHSKRKGGRSKKSSATRKPDICSLVEKLISIEERSKKVVKKSPHRERIKKVRRWLKSERKKKYKKAVVADSNVTTDVDKLITKFNSFTIVEKNPHLTRASNHIIKSKFSCKCCSDNDPDRPFSKSKKKKWSSRRKDTSSEQRTAKHLLLGKKKMKKNIDLRNEKYDRRLPLKKRLYRIAANSCTKTDSAGIATDVAQDINGKTISPTIPVPEENKEISCQSSSENSDETRIIPVTPKKRFQNKRQNVPNSETFSISPPLRSGSQCNDMITHSQVQVDLSTCKQTLQVKLSKISDEICKKMKSVTLLPSNDLKVSSSSSKDLNKVSKHRRNIPSAEQSNLNLEVKFDPIRNLTKDLNKCGTIDDTETYSPKTKEKQVSIPKADSDDNCSIDQKDQATQFIRKTTSVSNDCHTVPIESVTSSKNRKKRKRTINRTGFPTKKKKKKSNTSNETNVKEKTLSTKLHIGSKDPVRHGETIVLTPLTTDKIKHFPSTSKFFPEPSCFVENGSNLVNGQHVVPNSGEENVENVSFLGTTLHQQINPSTQNRRVSLRARPRQRRDSLLLAEANKKSCDKKTKHETRLQDFHELMERSKLIIAEKKYLQAGLFSDQFKVNDVEIDSCCEQKNCELDVSSLPSLSYYAERVRQKTDFTLPFDVWASHRAPKTLTRIKSNRNEYSKECDDSGSGSDLNEDMSDTFDGSNPSFSFFLPRKLHAFGSEGRTTTLLTDEQSKFIRANSCFLIRNLIKVQAIVVDKNNSASSNRGNELKLNIKSDASTKKLETISQTLQSFQKLKETSKEINNLQQDASMESKECNRNLLSEEKSKLKFENSASCNCSSQFVENHTSSRRTQSSRKLFSGNDANKSCSQILVSGTPETSIEVGLTQMGNGQKYFKALTSENCIIQTGENVYITKDNSELKLDETVATSIFGRADCNVFHIERLWRDENNDGYAFGYYFLRPHETFHEPSRRFFPNELMKSPLCETIPISRIVGHCHVLNLSSYCREKPASADLDHIFICEYRVDKGAKTFSRIPKRKACFSSDETTEFHLPPLKPVRNFKPYDATSNFRKIKKQHKTLKHTDTNEIPGVHYVGGSHRSTSLANYSTDSIDERTQQQQPHSITSKISRTEDYAF